MKKVVYRFVIVKYNCEGVPSGRGMFNDQTRQLEQAMQNGEWLPAQSPRVRKTSDGSEVYFLEKEVEADGFVPDYDVLNVTIYPDRMEIR